MDESTAQAAAQAAESQNGTRPSPHPGMSPEAAQILTELADLRLRLQANQAALGIVVGVSVMVLVAVVVSTRKLLTPP